MTRPLMTRPAQRTAGVIACASTDMVGTSWRDGHTLIKSEIVWLVQKRQLSFAACDLRRRSADEVLQRASQMRLVEVTRVVDDLEDRHAGLQQVRGSARAFDLARGGLGDPGGTQEVPLLGAAAR